MGMADVPDEADESVEAVKIDWGSGGASVRACAHLEMKVSANASLFHRP